MLKVTYCRCEFPQCMRSEVNYCAFCHRLIPIADRDLSEEQRQMKTKLEAVGVRWPKAESR